MLRNRVLMFATLTVALVLALELAGAIVGQRVEGAFRQSHAWARETGLNLEFDAFLVRAAGEGASAVLADSEEYAEEALEAIEAARERLARLHEADRRPDELRASVVPLRALQDRALDVLAGALESLKEDGPHDESGRIALVEAFYAYEEMLPRLRAAGDDFEHASQDLASARLAHWRGLSDVLAIGRLVALVFLVLVLTRMLQGRVVRPVRELAAAADKVRASDFSARVPEQAGFELGELQRSFNAMAGRLETYRDEAASRETALREALQAAEAASRAKSAFVAGVSHELRTPMHGVLGTADLLLMRALPEEERARIDDIRRSAETLLAIINDILDLSRLESGRLEIHFAPIAVRPQLAEMVEPLVAQAHARGLELQWTVDAAVPEWVLGDAGRLRQVLGNLLGNAVKFTQQGRIELKVGAEGLDGRRLRFEVRDTGPGIAAEALTRIFEPFEQGDRSISRQQGGTGLGLAICRLLVSAMGGRLEVHSEAGKGACFWFSLPLPACDSPPQPHSPHATVGAEFRGRILVAEDHPVNQTLAVAMLDTLGCRCEVAADGHEALAAMERQDYDLVLMDCQMPHLDGMAATRMIRAREGQGGRRTVVVAMTAGAMQADREAALSAGMDDFLAKPFTVEELRRILSRWLTAH